MKTITRKEFFDKYGDVEVKFVGYYKYVFTYKGTAPDGTIIVVGDGGDSSDIYKMDVNVDDAQTVKHLYPFQGSAFIGEEIIEQYYE